MLKELERYFVKMGWYDKTREFLTIKLEGGFEAFSGRASETWEYRWVIQVHNHPDLGIPEFFIWGKRFETLDDVAARALR
ncbi:MAG: hypothetical protein JW866_00080 [Ignavibacteriales bacterium]|nr:hypothetical protein [Ignavibacteriales bacterium]